MAKSTKLFGLCSLLMAMLFSYTAPVQFNDPGTLSSFSPLLIFVPMISPVINLLQSLAWAISPKGRIQHLAKGTLWLGIFLFIKVVVEDHLSGIAGFLSLDLTERVVREKIGSGFVITSMILHLIATSEPLDPRQRKQNRVSKYVAYGVAILVGFSFGHPFVFLVIQKGEIKL
ncbi:hypothetical protein SLA2020_469680 [Shorea laevis]